MVSKCSVSTATLAFQVIQRLSGDCRMKLSTSKPAQMMALIL